MRNPLHFVVALCAATLLFLAPSPARADSVSGDTSVVFSASTAASLSGMGLTITPLGKASFDTTTLTLLLPITSGSLGASGDIFNSDGSGFSVSNGSVDVTFRNLVVNTATGTLSGNMHFGSTQINELTIFDIGPDGSLTLDAKAAADLSTAFGMTNLAGTNVGTASISIPLSTGDPVGSAGRVTSAPEPSSLILLASSILALAALALYRRNRSELRTA